MKRVLALAIVGVPLLASCAPVDGMLARYRLEQELWRAQFFERRINIQFARGSRQDIQQAIAAFQRLLAEDPLSTPAAANWDKQVVSDIRQLRVSSQIGLANLYFLSDRYADAGTMYSRTLESGDLSPRRSLDARLGAARSLYLAGETSAVMEQCAAIFRELLDTPEFWNGDQDLSDVFLNVPVALVRMYTEAGDSARAGEYARLASGFYDRVARERAGTSVGWQAQLGLVQLHLVRKEWRDAAAGVQSILADPSQKAGNADDLMLLAGEVYGFALNDTTRAIATFADVIRQYPQNGSSYAARYDIGALRKKAGNTAGAVDMFRKIEQDDRAPAAIAARAMFSRAAILEQQGAWDESYALLQRLQQLYPYTAAAIEAPLAITRHYSAVGQPELARRSLDRARDYYMGLLDRTSQFQGDRMVVQAALTESYVAAGDASDVAELLGSGSPQWDETSTAAGMLKSAEVYATVLHEPDQAVAMLKKCIERFPETRYSKVAQARLDELEGRSR